MESHTSIRHKALLLLALLPPSLAQYPNRNSKRGIAYMGDTHKNDNTLLISRNTPLSWYYNWSPYPPTDQIPHGGPLEFIPLIHGIDGAQNSRTAQVINSLPSSSQHLLSFNEPDGTTDSGGSSISPENAARAYIDHIVPYRDGKNGRKWKISHPSTTGSPMGLNWLRRFNESCYRIDQVNGCPTDFVAAHWYGAFDGLAAWLGTLDEFYNKNTSSNLKIWVTEMALPQADTKATVAMMNQTLPYLDGLDYLERYSWFGAFRTDEANAWTGDSVALFDDNGGLTELGALYMGGQANGFSKGQKGEGGESAAVDMRVDVVLLLSLCMFVTMISNYL